MSEARALSYIAVARREVPVKHWFALGRNLVEDDRYLGLASWTGTAFEYLMPAIFLPVVRYSLTDEAIDFALYEQRKLGARRRVPWGVSESGYYDFDNAFNFQYRAFGVPKLALKRGMERDNVVAPYATFLSLPFTPKRAYENLDRLEALGARGEFGFFEAVDFTPERTDRRELVKSFMAHHVGMSLAAVDNAAFDNRMQRRFMADPAMAAARELLEEKLPVGPAKLADRPARQESAPRVRRRQDDALHCEGYDLDRLRCGVLSNGALTLVDTDAGLGFLRFRERMLLRFRQEKSNPFGAFFLVRAGGSVFSLTPAPLYQDRVEYASAFSCGSITHSAKHRGWTGELKSTLLADSAAVIYEIGVRRQGRAAESCELLFYAEPTLNAQSAEAAHPAFSNLSIETHYDERRRILYYRRRPRAEGEGELWMAAALRDSRREFLFETRRERLLPRLSRGEDLTALFERKFSGDTGTPLDAACAIRLTLSAQDRGSAALILAAGETREQCEQAVSAARQASFAGAAGVLAEHTRMLRRRCGATGEQEKLMAALLPKLIWEDHTSSRRVEAIEKNTLSQSGLWKYGVSGDNPILLLELGEPQQLERAEPYFRLHALAGAMGIAFDLVVLYAEAGDYHRPFYNALKELLRKTGQSGALGDFAGVHLINTEGMEDAYRTLFYAAAALSRELDAPGNETQPEELEDATPPHLTARRDRKKSAKPTVTVHGDRVEIRPSGVPHAPYGWMLANRTFGTMVSDRAILYSFAYNARENKLSPWSGDALREAGEYLLLEMDGERWDLLACSSRAEFSPGAAQYETKCGGITAKITVCVPEDCCAKVCDVELTSDAEHTVRLLYNFRPVLGVDARHAMFVSSERRGETLIMKNPYNSVYPGEMGFLSARSKGGGLHFERGFESGVSAVVTRKLPGKKSEKIRYVLGVARSERELLRSVEELMRREDVAAHTRRESRELLGALEVSTPDADIDALVNTLLPYQTIASRIRGRTGFYQCGGAYGFRDQLQDCANMALQLPQELKVHILRCAAHQFVEGDVQHWWHPLPQQPGMGHPGVRTRCSDDMLWLPWAVCEYLDHTADWDILDIRVPYLDAAPLKPGEQERYFTPRRSELRESLYEHCVRAIAACDKSGAHGMTLIRGGDWNDGMNRVGTETEGESVWLTWFLSMVLRRFAALTERRGGDAGYYTARAQELCAAVQSSGYNGSWYLRGFYADGTPLGEPGAGECEIDLITQAFAVLASDGRPERCQSAMGEAWERLFDREAGIIKLLWPPFADGPHDPGYIRGYGPGLRENGGQYTHGAVWGAMGVYALGDAQRGFEMVQALNPLRRAEKEISLANYRVEPYVIAADVYANPDHYARGGWTWYTGSAGWYYTLLTRVLLGLRMSGGKIWFSPALPRGWEGFRLRVRLGSKTAEVECRRGEDAGVYLDGQRMDGPFAFSDGAKIKLIL
nr:glucoamylase family protein [Feifania hominis]